MDVKELAEAFTALCRDGRYEEAEAHWAEDVVSLEAMPGERARLVGREAIKTKHAWWVGAMEVHSQSVTGPFIHGDQFAVIFELDVTERASGARSNMREVALYTVKDGKIVEERFFY